MIIPSASVPVVDNMGVLSEPWYRALTAVAHDIPKASQAFVVRGLIDPAWYTYLSQTAAPNAAATPINRDRTMSRAWYTYLSQL